MSDAEEYLERIVSSWMRKRIIYRSAPTQPEPEKRPRARTAHTKPGKLKVFSQDEITEYQKEVS